MPAPESTPATIDAYIATHPPEVRAILEEVRATIRAAAPEAEEFISYRMPAFRLHGIIVYFAAFRNHIGLYPPVRGDENLEKAVAKYAGVKGNLRFPLDEPIPYPLIARITRMRVQQNQEKAAAKKKTTPKDQPAEKAKARSTPTATTASTAKTALKRKRAMKKKPE